MANASDEERWDRAFARSQNELQRLAEEALAEYRTRELAFEPSPAASERSARTKRVDPVFPDRFRGEEIEQQIQRLCRALRPRFAEHCSVWLL